ncbi:MAG TPA: indole-3-glycerol phosphate synthase TrpC [Thermoanaerobaculia bacterium]|jgi:indole-3-glycerol phosphate synthase|nr:indole-3-glycerol phosphate synthase TrpC [Thermoanaerobaculia bacterium]
MTILDDIVARTRARLGTEPPPARAAAETAARNRAPFALTAALRHERINVIAEIKSASPSAGTIVDDPDVEAIAASYKDGGAAAISIVTEPEFFHGSREWIARAAGLPVLMKDFVIEESQLIRGMAAGASAILLLASLLDATQIRDFIACLDAYSCDALVEVHDEAELERAINAGARIIGVNNRNLRDFSVDLGGSERLARQIPDGVLRVAESGIKTRAEVDRLRAAGFDAFLVGESLLRQTDRAAAVRQLVLGS